MKSLKALCLVVLLSLHFTASAERIKDVSMVEGVRSNQLVGYGLVVGLPGTGEQNSYTQQSFRGMLNSFGITLPSTQSPKIKNVAAVAVHAELPAFRKPGQTIDITVSSIGSAGSLRGGTLLQTFLKGVDGNVYAIAQGSLIVGGLGAQGLDGSKVVINTPTVGRVPNGATVERAVESPFMQGDYITFNLNRPDFTTAKRLEKTINDLVGPNSAQALDAASIRVLAPRDASSVCLTYLRLKTLSLNPLIQQQKLLLIREQVPLLLVKT